MLRWRHLGLIVAAGCSFRHGTVPLDTGDVDADQDGPIDAPPDAKGPIAQHVQNTTAIVFGTTLTATFKLPVQAGDLLIGSFRASNLPTVSDNVNGTWTQVATTTGNMYMFYCANTAATTSLMMTMTVQSDDTLRIVADEFSGIAKSAALDQATSSQNSGATSWTAPATPSIPAGELVYAAIGNINNGVVFTPGTTNGVQMTEGGHVSDGTNGVSFTEYALAAAAGPQAVSVSIAPADGCAGVQGTFHTL
jgi:hypothetical protein